MLDYSVLWFLYTQCQQNILIYRKTKKKYKASHTTTGKQPIYSVYHLLQQIFKNNILTDAIKPHKKQGKNQMPSCTAKRFATQAVYTMIKNNATWKEIKWWTFIFIYLHLSFILYWCQSKCLGRKGIPEIYSS